MIKIHFDLMQYLFILLITFGLLVASLSSVWIYILYRENIAERVYTKTNSKHRYILLAVSTFYNNKYFIHVNIYICVSAVCVRWNCIIKKNANKLTKMWWYRGQTQPTSRPTVRPTDWEAKKRNIVELKSKWENVFSAPHMN